MTNPPFILEHLDAIAECLNHPSVFAYLHVPVQSGSDAVLTAMNREYNVAEFRTVIARRQFDFEAIHQLLNTTIAQIINIYHQDLLYLARLSGA